MLDDQSYLLEQFKQASKHDGATTQRPEHLGTDRTMYGLRNAKRREIIQDWINANKDVSYEDWLALIDGLYHGESYEERCAPQTLLLKFPAYRRQLPLSQLDQWLGLLEGWAEVDSTCQSVFTANDILEKWGEWQALLEQLSYDDNIHKRRASLVLLTTPVTNSPDERLFEQSIQTIETLKHENHKLITKAISWLLRKAIKQHRSQIETYLEEHAESLPAIAVRETQKKLETGKK